MGSLQTKTARTDVLVIGAGAAASRAALESSLAGAGTVMATKGRYGAAGTSCYRVAEAAGFSASKHADPEDSPAQHKADILDAALGPCSPELAGIVAENAPGQVPFLESLGLEYQRYEGNYLATRGCFATRRRSIKIKGHGEPIVAALKAEILRRGEVDIREETMALELIVEGGRCVGAYLLDGNGVLTEMRAGAVILGTGGAGQLFSQSLNPPDITGDGYALAYRAGASIVNMEFMQAGFGAIEPAKTIFNAWIWGLNPKICDEKGAEFIQDYLPKGVSLAECVEMHQTHYPFSSRDASKYLEIAVKRKYNEGGRVFADLRDIESRRPEGNLNLDQMWPITKAWMKRCGIDTDSAVMRLVCYAHAINGGVRINRDAQSSVPGLYAVGEAAGGPHGADRLGGNMFSSGQVFGEIAGRHAARTALERPFAASGEGNAPAAALGGVSDRKEIEEVRGEIRDLAGEHLLIIRNGEGLRTFLDRMERAAGRLCAMRSATAEDLMYLEETKNLVQAGMLMARAALLRAESRGSHYREDFPEMGGDGWRRAIQQRLENGVPVLEQVTL